MPQDSARLPLLSVADAASLAGVSESTMRRWVRAGPFPFLRLPTGAYRIPESAFFAVLAVSDDRRGSLMALDARAGDITDEDVRRAVRKL